MSLPRILVFACLCACATGDGSRSTSSNTDDSAAETTAAPTGCDAWANWSCETSDNYCFAQCSEGGSDHWMKCYPGLGYDCQGTFRGGNACSEYSGGDAGDECAACASALESCGV